MDLPIPLILPTLLTQGNIFYFENPKDSSDRPHNYVLLNKNATIESTLLLAVASSKVSLRMAARKNEPPETLVVVQPLEHNDFTEPTVFDCNSPLIVPYPQLKQLIETFGCIKPRGRLNQAIVEKIINGVRSSRLVADGFKHLIDG